MSKRKSKGDIAWYIKGKKRPIAYSTVATSDLISVLAQEGLTVLESYNYINYDMEAKAILQLYIENGYGNKVLNTI